MRFSTKCGASASAHSRYMHNDRTFVRNHRSRGLASSRERWSAGGVIATGAPNLRHHPDVLLAWGKVGVTIFTHKINGLTESDFILAARIETLPRRR